MTPFSKTCCPCGQVFVRVGSAQVSYFTGSSKDRNLTVLLVMKTNSKTWIIITRTTYVVYACVTYLLLNSWNIPKLPKRDGHYELIVSFRGWKLSRPGISLNQYESEKIQWWIHCFLLSTFSFFILIWKPTAISELASVLHFQSRNESLSF